MPVIREPVLNQRFSKMQLTCASVFLAALLLDFKTIKSFRLQMVDLPMLIWCVCPLLSSLANDLGLFDAYVAAREQFIGWGLPYFIGRIYLTNHDRLREMAIGIVLSGLIYVPLCLLEIRLSPQLHTWMYGYPPRMNDFSQQVRYGGYRPVVFMDHSLAVAAWMSTATLTSFWLWRSDRITRFRLAGLTLPLGLAGGPFWAFWCCANLWERLR